jgi:2,3,4,5-tetrahydropyridine-2-carboxylate N-succinyltransferase
VNGHNPKIIGSGVWIDPRVHFGENVTIGHGSCIGFPDEDESELKIMDNVSIGAFCVISMGSVIEKNVSLEHYCRVDSKSTIGENTKLLYAARVHWKVTIGKNCVIGGNAPDRTIIGNNVRHFGRLVHDQRDRSGGWDATEEPSPVLRDRALIGANAIIIGGIEIGEDSVIAANEVVKENVPSKSIFSHGKIKPLKQKS